MLQLLERGENGGQFTTAEGRNYSNAGPALRNVTSHCGESQNGRPSETDLV